MINHLIEYLVCQHRSFECIQVSYRNFNKCITNFNRLTTVAHVIDALLVNLDEKSNFGTNDCCLYVERPPYLYPLKTDDFIQDILLRYAPESIHFKLSFKRNASPSRYAQRKRLLRTPIPSSTVTNAYEQLKIQESLIRRQHEIIQALRKTSLSRDSSRSRASHNFDNYFDWVTRTDADDSDDSRYCCLQSLNHNRSFIINFHLCRELSNCSSISTRSSRQDQYQRSLAREPSNSVRSSSQVRFRPSVVHNRQPMEPVLKTSFMPPVKSILKKSSDTRSPQRTSSVDRDIEQLTSLKFRRSSVYASDDADDSNLSDQSTTDSCLGSLSSNDSSSCIVQQHQLETLV